MTSSSDFKWGDKVLVGLVTKPQIFVALDPTNDRYAIVIDDDPDAEPRSWKLSSVVHAPDPKTAADIFSEEIQRQWGDGGAAMPGEAKAFAATLERIKNGEASDIEVKS